MSNRLMKKLKVKRTIHPLILFKGNLKIWVIMIIKILKVLLIMRLLVTC